MEEQALSVTNDEMQKKVVLLMAREKAALQNNGASRPNTTAAEPAAPEGEEESATVSSRGCYSILVVSCFMLSGALDSSHVLLPYTTASIKSPMANILISTPKHPYLYVYTGGHRKSSRKNENLRRNFEWNCTSKAKN